MQRMLAEVIRVVVVVSLVMLLLPKLGVDLHAQAGKEADKEIESLTVKNITITEELTLGSSSGSSGIRMGVEEFEENTTTGYTGGPFIKLIDYEGKTRIRISAQDLDEHQLPRGPRIEMIGTILPEGSGIPEKKIVLDFDGNSPRIVLQNMIGRSTLLPADIDLYGFMFSPTLNMSTSDVISGPKLNMSGPRGEKISMGFSDIDNAHWGPYIGLLEGESFRSYIGVRDNKGKIILLNNQGKVIWGAP